MQPVKTRAISMLSGDVTASDYSSILDADHTTPTFVRDSCQFLVQPWTVTLFLVRLHMPGQIHIQSFGVSSEHVLLEAQSCRAATPSAIMDNDPNHSLYISLSNFSNRWIHITKHQRVAGLFHSLRISLRFFPTIFRPVFGGRSNR